VLTSEQTGRTYDRMCVYRRVYMCNCCTTVAQQ